MEVVLVCENCGGTNIQVQGWIDPNTYEACGIIDDGHSWCETCNEDGVSFKEKLVKNKNLYLKKHNK